MKKIFYKDVLLTAGFFILNGCSVQMPTVVRHNLWNEMRSTQGSPDFHLVVVWQENEKWEDKEHKLSHPEILAEALTKEYAAGGAGKILSYQIVESIDDLQAWIGIWYPETPVLFVNANFKTNITTANWTATLSAHARFQALLFDTTVDKKQVEVKSSKYKNTGQSYMYRSFIKEWLEKAEPELYNEFAKKLIGQMPTLEKKETALHIFGGKSPALKEAQTLSQQGNWQAAIQIWEKESKQDPKNKKIYHNLSVAYEMMGDWDNALKYQKSIPTPRARDMVSLNPLQAMKTMGAMMTSAIDIDRLSMLEGLAALKKNQKKKIALKPSSTIAILPLANDTNDLKAPERVREELSLAAKRLGSKLVPLQEIDEKLRQNGYTDAGQFRSTTPQSLGKIVSADFLVMGNVELFRQLPREEVKTELKVVYAPTGETIYAKTFHIVPKQEYSNVGSASFKIIEKAAGMLLKKATGSVLKEECRSLTDRFVRAWPNFLP